MATWDLSTTAAWSTAASGTPPATFASGDDAFFETAASNTVSLGADVIANSISQSLNGTATTINRGAGNLITLASGNISNTGNALLAINADLSLGASGTIDATKAINLGGSVSGSGFTKTGSDTLTLTGNNSYTGTTTVSAGTVVFNNPNSQSLGALDGAAGILQNSGAGDLSFTQAAAGSSNIGTLGNNGTGRLTLNAGAGSATTIATIAGISGTIVNFGGDASGATTITNTLSTTGQLVKVANSAVTLSSSRNMTSNLEVDGGSLTFAKRYSVNIGNGVTFTLNGGVVSVPSTSDYGFRTSGDNGASSGGNNSVVWTGTQTGGTLLILHGSQGTSFSMGSNTTGGSSTYTLSGTGVVASIASTNNGYLDLGADIGGTATTTFNLSGGTLLVNKMIQGAQGNGAKQAFVWTGGTLTTAAYDATKLTSTAGTAVSAVTNTLTNAGGILAPGFLSPITAGAYTMGTQYTGKTSITGNYNVTSPAAKLAINLGGNSAATAFGSAANKYDNVAVTGAVTLGGTLDVAFINGFVPGSGDSFTILSAGSVTGSFTNAVWGERMLTADGLGSFIPSLEGNQVVLHDFAWEGDAPFITNPPNALVVLSGKSATFSVGVTGKPPFTYQWYKGGDPISGATLPWLTIGSVSPGDAASYHVVVTNSSGSATSSSASLTVSASSSALQQILYHMDQPPVSGTGAIIDASGLTSGTVLNSPAPSLIPGALSSTGSAWDFGQSTGYINVAACDFLDKLGDISRTTGITVGLWVNLDYQGGGSMNNSCVFGLGAVANGTTPNASNAELDFTFGSSPTLATSITQLDGNWHYMVATLDFQKQSNNLVLYVDGTAVSTKSYPVTRSFNSPGTALGIGALNNGFHSWAGRIDEFTIFDRALVAGEVTSLYNTGAVTTPAPLVAVGVDANLVQWPGSSTTAVHATVTPSATGVWTKTSGPAATIANPNSANTAVTFSGTGTYVLRYTVTSNGITNYGETSITVAANQAPVVTMAAAAPAILAAHAADRTVILSAHVTDDGMPNPPGILSTTWSQLSGPAPITISYPGLIETPATIPPTPGTYVVQIAANDGVAETTATATIQVVDNLPPQAVASADANTVVWNGSGARATLRGSITDDDHPLDPGLLSGTWNQLGGPAAATFDSPSSSAPNNGLLAADTPVSLPSPGQYVFRLTASDGALVSTADTWVTVWSPDAIEVNAGASRVTWLPSATLDLEGTHNANPGTSTVQWSVVRGPGNVVFSNPNAPATNATFDTAGKYQLRFKVTNGSWSGEDTLVAEVYDASYNFGYSAAELARFTQKPALGLDRSHTAWSRLAPPPPPCVHPRILFNPDDLPDLRQRLSTSTTSGPVVMNNIRASAARLTAANGTWRAAYDALAAGDAGVFNVQADRNGMAAALKNECFRALIDDDPAGGAKAAAALATLADSIYQTLPSVLTPPLTDWRDKLQGPAYADTLGWSYDFVYNWMTADQRTSVRQTLALMTNNVWNVGLDSLPGYSANNSNWIPLTGQALLFNTLAIEGESGSDPGLLLRYEALYDRMCDSLAFPDGATYEGMGKGWIGIESYFALAKRGHKGVFSETVRNHIRSFYLHCMETTGYGWTWDEVIGGSNQAAKFQDVEVSKFLFPTDPVVDFIYRNACGVNFASSPNFTGGGILEAICAENLLNPSQAWNAALAAQVAPAAPLTQFFNMRGLMVTRSGWSSDALRLMFQPRSEPGGHSIPDRNQIVLSGLGRIWAPWDIYGSGSGYLPGDNSMAASVVRVDDAGSSTLPAAVVDFHDSPDFTYAAGDAADCYGKAFGSSATPVDFTPNDKLLTKNPMPWADQPWGTMPDWYTSRKSAGTWLNTRPVKRAFRTAGIFRGGTLPYAVIVDDIQMDNATHNYKWRLMLANDLTSVTVNGNDAVITSPGGSTSLLVRLLGCSGSATFRTNNTYQWFDWPWIDIEVNAVAPDFKVLLLPFPNGTVLPATTWNGNVLDVHWPGGGTDHLLFSPNADGRTRVSFSRNGADNVAPVLSLPSDIVTTADSPEGKLVTFTASATDAVDGPVALECSPPSGSIFPIGTTTVTCSAHDSALNGAGGAFTVTVNPGGFALSAPAVSIQGGNASASISWAAVPAAASYSVMRSTTSGSGFATVASGITGTRFVDTGLTNGMTYLYQVAAANGAGSGPESNEAAVVPSALPKDWSSSDIGSHGAAGSGIVSADGSSTLASSGTGMGGTSDSIQFTGQPWTGDGAIVVRVLGFQNANNSSRAGVMFRQGVAANSAFGYVGCQYYASDYALVSRATDGAAAVWGAGTHSSLPQWFKLVRIGNTLTAWQAPDSTPGVQSWKQVGSAAVSLSSPMLAGLMTSSASTGTSCTASFDHFGIYTTPVIHQPANFILASTGPLGAPADFTVTGESNIDGRLVAACTPPSGSILPIGTTVVSAVVTDSAGQTSATTFTVTVTNPPISPAETSAPAFTLAAGNATLTIGASIPGRTYQLQRSDSMQPDSWTNAGVPMVGDGGQIILTDPAAPGVPRRFYRVLLDP